MERSQRTVLIFLSAAWSLALCAKSQVSVSTDQLPFAAARQLRPRIGRQGPARWKAVRASHLRKKYCCHMSAAGSLKLLCAVQPAGLREMDETVAFYKENAAILRGTFEEMGFSVYGGTDAPYVWVGFPGQSSWDVFADILAKCHIVTTPGSGFGPGGEGFVRVSAFGHR